MLGTLYLFLRENFVSKAYSLRGVVFPREATLLYSDEYRIGVSYDIKYAQFYITSVLHAQNSINRILQIILRAFLYYYDNTASVR